MDPRTLGFTCQPIRCCVWAGNRGLHVLPTFRPSLGGEHELFECGVRRSRDLGIDVLCRGGTEAVRCTGCTDAPGDLKDGLFSDRPRLKQRIHS
jgi:hypothetical protein